MLLSLSILLSTYSCLGYAQIQLVMTVFINIGTRSISEAFTQGKQKTKNKPYYSKHTLTLKTEQSKTRESQPCLWRSVSARMKPMEHACSKAFYQRIINCQQFLYDIIFLRPKEFLCWHFKR